ncbi:MAG: amino acid kinase [Gemmatimonadales bacterium]
MNNSVADFSVIKVGGGLSRLPGALEQVCSALQALSQLHPLLLVPGGGPFADAVRTFEGRTTLSPTASHWMAILAMDQYAYVLADRVSGGVIVEEPGEIREVLSLGKIPIMAPARWMRSADVLPHSWEVTSDSIAAFVAGALGAGRLALIKPAVSDDSVDCYFRTALPAGMPYLIVSWEHLDELSDWLSEQTAAASPPE